MKKFFTLVFICLYGSVLNAGQTLYGGLSYTQRGILKIGGGETAVTVYVRSFDDKAAMQMESQIGMLCRIEIDSNGNPTLLENSPAFNESWVRKFVLRDFLKILGKSTDASPEGYTVRLSKYKTLSKSKRAIPEEIVIKDECYSISLSTVKVRE